MIQNDIDFEFFWQRIQRRTLAQISILHLFIRKDGRLHCLDLDLSAADQDSLHSQIRAVYRTQGLDQVHPHAPLEDWRELNKALRRIQGGIVCESRYRLQLPERLITIITATEH